MSGGGLFAATYYVDFAGGTDSQAGTSAEQSWKHSPGDPQAGDRARSVKLEPGDTILFKGGTVYRGSIRVPCGGAPGKRITYKGDGWGSSRAIIDGSDILTGWTRCTSAAEAGGNPDYPNLFFTYVPASCSPFLMNLHEMNSVNGEDEFLWMSQMPNPSDRYFFNRRDGLQPVKHDQITLESVVSPELLTQQDARSLDGASALVWGNPNWTLRREIREYIPAESKIVFTAPLEKNSIYTDGRDQAFAIYNSPLAIDVPGEYAVTPPDAAGRRKVILWPRSPENLEQSISRSVRKTGIETGPHSHVEVSGFEIRKFGGDALREGCAILAYGGQDAERTDTVLRNNLIYHNQHGSKGYGGIFAHKLHDSLIESNTVVRNAAHAGIFLSECEDSVVQGNTIQYTGNTALRMYTCKRLQVLRNRINHIYSTHANGITLYLGCYDVLVANNTVTDATTPITHQNSGNLYFINNVIDGQGENKNANEWPFKKSGGTASGKIVYLNNTFINAEARSSLSLGRDSSNEYIVVNNILDGLGFTQKITPKLVLHSYNLFTGRNYAQTAKYGWINGEKEIDAPMKTVFEDPDGMNFHLKADSPAIGAGTDVSAFYPVTVFPGFDFRLDMDGRVRNGWDCGAYGAP
jgi:parallel beta-helix repeat protein